jgi:hypothetical protein
MGQKDRRRNTGEPKWKRKKTGKDFWAAENWKFNSNGFLFKNSSNICKWDLVLFISSHRIKWSK